MGCVCVYMSNVCMYHCCCCIVVVARHRNGSSWFLVQGLTQRTDVLDGGPDPAVERKTFPASGVLDFKISDLVTPRSLSDCYAR